MSNTGNNSQKKFDSVALYKIRRLLADLSNKTGRGTELVTLYLPPKKPVHEAISALREESGTASNIKSDTTRAHVEDALTKTMQRLRLYKQTPENGLVIFCGAIPGPGGPGNETIELYEVLPNKPVTNYLYRCDDHFHLDPLRDMLKEENVIGVLAMDSTEAGLGIVSGDNWDVIDVTSSGVSGKTRKGGQCVSEDTLIQLEDGKLASISEISTGSKIASFNFTDFSNGFFDCADTYSTVPSEYYMINTIRPQMRILSTGEHRFFTVNSQGVSTVQAYQLRKGDRILVSRKLQEPNEPNLKTRFAARFLHKISPSGVEMLKQWRLRRGFTQIAAARAIGLHQTEFSQIERGERSLTWTKFSKILEFLADDPSTFITKYVERVRTLPEYFTPQLAQLLGYILGDGSLWKNRVTLYEQRLEVARYYSEIAKKILNLKHVPVLSIDKTGRVGSFAKHPYFEIRINFKDFSDGVRQNYPELVSNSRSIPDQICRLDNHHLSYFLRGLFDAEGYIHERRLGIAMKSGSVIRALQMLLLRFGIVSSYRTYLNRFGTTMHSLDISNLDSIKLYLQNIGFTSRDKNERLIPAAKPKVAQSYLSVPVMGSWVDEKAKKAGIRREKFLGITNFFSDTRGASRQVFRRVLGTFENALSEGIGSQSLSMGKREYLQRVVTKLSMIEKSELILAVVSEARVEANTKGKKFVDIELPETGSFIGNGFILHNSARRYERLREMELTDYYNRLADHAKKAFLESNHVKGLIVSGPGPTKDAFVKDGYLDYRLQNMVVGVLDTGYSGREGVRETIEKAGKLLENVRVVEEKKLVQKFLFEVNSDSGLAIYGVQDILVNLKRAAVDTILVNDDTDMIVLRATCEKCGNAREKFVYRSSIVVEKQNLLSSPCPNCSSLEMEIKESDIVDYLSEASIDSGAKVEVISSKTEDGAMLKSYGGIAALLRYRAS